MIKIIITESIDENIVYNKEINDTTILIDGSNKNSYKIINNRLDIHSTKLLFSNCFNLKPKKNIMNKEIFIKNEKLIKDWSLGILIEYKEFGLWHIVNDEHDWSLALEYRTKPLFEQGDFVEGNYIPGYGINPNTPKSLVRGTYVGFIDNKHKIITEDKNGKWIYSYNNSFNSLNLTTIVNIKLINKL